MLRVVPTLGHLRSSSSTGPPYRVPQRLAILISWHWCQCEAVRPVQLGSRETEHLGLGPTPGGPYRGHTIKVGFTYRGSQAQPYSSSSLKDSSAIKSSSVIQLVVQLPPGIISFQFGRAPLYTLPCHIGTGRPVESPTKPTREGLGSSEPTGFGGFGC